MTQKVVFGLSLSVAQELKEAMEKEILQRFPGIQSVCRYRREGLYQYVKQQEEALVIMEEYLQGGESYPVEELQKLTDLDNNRIVFLMSHKHVGDNYVKALYCCGIYNGLYLDEVSPKEIMKLLQHERTNEQARSYYGIQTLRDAEKEKNMVNEERLNTYLEYLDAEVGSGELGEKYRFVSTRLGAEENRILAENLIRQAAEQLRGNEIFEFYKNADKGKRHLFRRGSIKNYLKLPVQPEEEQKNTSVMDNEAIPNAEDGITDAIDRFWAVDNDSVAGMEIEQTDMRLIFGEYLKRIDE